MPRQVIDLLRAGRCMRRLGEEKDDLLRDVIISRTSCAMLQETKSNPVKRKSQHQLGVVWVGAGAVTRVMGVGECDIAAYAL
jgi:hypothetical protein